MKILNLNQSRFEDDERWRQYAVPITDLDPDWPSRLLIFRAWKLLGVANRFDVILFHLDIRLAAVFGVLNRLRAARAALIFQGFEFDTSRDTQGTGFLASARHRISRSLHEFVLKMMDVVVLHTSAEIQLYSQFFRVSEQKFVFLPYFHYGSDPAATMTAESTEGVRVLAIGRHRDFDCFIEANRNSGWTNIIVGGDSDRVAVKENLPPGFSAQFEISREDYREQIARATIVVLPFFEYRWQRALGHIAMFEAMLKKKPIVAARTFHLRDYASDNEVLYYRPGDACDLRRQLDRLVADESLRARLVVNAQKRLSGEFTREKYIARLLDACRFAADQKLQLQSSSRRVRSLRIQA